uniref:Methyltransferase like 25 n=1 Tax=Tetraodon nigroviridis TaxID=99883 RepID=H3D0C6_TETNG
YKAFIMIPSSITLPEIHRRIDEVKRFLSITLSIANAHTVEFYTHDVWNRFMAVDPQEVLHAFSASNDQQMAPEHHIKVKSGTTFGFCNDTNLLVDPRELLQAATAHSLPGLGICMSREELLLALGEKTGDTGAEWVPDEFMNSKKSHEVQSMSEVVARLAQHCGVKQVIDVGSGKGYLSSSLSLRYGLQVYGIDSSSTNTHGAQERNRKLKKFSRAYQKRNEVARAQSDAAQTRQQETTRINPEEVSQDHKEGAQSQEEEMPTSGLVAANSGREDLFLRALSEDLVQTATPRLPPSQLSADEKERRKRENLERKAHNRATSSPIFAPLTSHVTAETELGELIQELEKAVMVGLHTCGDLAPSTLRMFVAKAELAAVCSVGCCYHLLSEQFDPSAQGNRDSSDTQGACGFPLSQYLLQRSCFCGRNARMSACLALERVSLGQGIQMESLFFRAVLHVILKERLGFVRSEKRVGNVYSKTKSFVDYVRRALSRLELDGSKLSDDDIQGYHDAYAPRMDEMHAFNMLKVALAPCIEGLILLDRLCYLKEQEHLPFCALVQLFNPLLSPRCYAVVGLKGQDHQV